MDSKNILTTVAGVVFAMAMALQGFEVPGWLRITAAVVAAGAGALMGVSIGRKANLRSKSKKQIETENNL